MKEEFTYQGQTKSKKDVRRAFETALDRRTTRAIVEAVKALASNTR